MIKYVPKMTSVVIEEIPDKVSLAVDISNCQGNCLGCHSPFLKDDVGEPLTEEIIKDLVAQNFGVDCFLFLGEGNDLQTILKLAAYVKSIGCLAAIYSGRTEVEPEIFQAFDYVKVGPYIEKYGPLNSRTTNQRLYKVEHVEDKTNGTPYTLVDMTSRFWHKGIDPSAKA